MFSLVLKLDADLCKNKHTHTQSGLYSGGIQPGVEKQLYSVNEVPVYFLKSQASRCHSACGALYGPSYSTYITRPGKGVPGVLQGHQ